ncbi:MAG: hypothetical protein M1819_000623 [Sarea resinae]|nr:MAG: hypothetical protein M1819_000623 [Sarea resinae]
MPPKKAQPKVSARRNVKAQEPPAESSQAASDSTMPGAGESGPAMTGESNAVAPSEEAQATAPARSSRPPVQRLASLRGRASASPAPGASGSKGPLKFKPKNVIRRSEEERLGAERERLARLQARQAAADAVAASARGGRGGRGRGGMSRGRGGGRGGFGRGDDRREGMASGPFSQMSEPMGRRRVFAQSGGSSLGSRHFSTKGPKVKREGNGDVAMDGSGIKSENGYVAYSSSEDDDPREGPRVAVEHINLVSDEEDSDEEGPTSIKGKGRAKAKPASSSGWGQRPVRINRKEHVDRSTAVNTEASSTTSAELRKKAQEKQDKGDLFVPLDEAAEVVAKTSAKQEKKAPATVQPREWKGVYQEDEDEKDKVQVKQEPTDENTMMMDVDAIPAHADASTSQAPKIKSAPPSPELKKNSLKPRPPKAQAKAKPPNKKRKGPTFTDPAPVLATEEDRAEWARHEEDVRLLAQELGQMNAYQKTAGTDTGTASAGEGGVGGEGEKQAEETQQQQQPLADRKEGRLYLFQFPPLVPGLVAPVVKKEESPAPPPVGDRKAPDAINIDNTNTPAAKKPAAARNPAAAAADHTPKPQPLTAPRAHLPAGRAGTLRIHRSGRVSLAWGIPSPSPSPLSSSGPSTTTTSSSSATATAPAHTAPRLHPPKSAPTTTTTPGSTPLTLHLAAPTDHLTDILLANPLVPRVSDSALVTPREREEAEEEVRLKLEGGGAGGGDGGAAGLGLAAWGLGAVSGKFVVVPDWEGMLR